MRGWLPPLYGYPRSRRGFLQQRAQNGHVGTRVADTLGDLVGVAVDDVHIGALGLAVDDGAVDDQRAARLDMGT